MKSLSGVWQNLVGDLLSALVLLAFGWLRSRYSLAVRTRMPLALTSFYPLVLAWLAVNVAISCYVVLVAQSFALLISVFFVSSITTLFLLFRELQKTRAVGIRGADQDIDVGVDYKRSLQLCRNHLRFLGIGASKLTEHEKELEEAIGRCRKDQPIKFLLLDPRNRSLVSAAKMHGEEGDAYSRRVKQSLKKIAELKKERKFNIQVRFYSQRPMFRLMFIDDSVCLVSYYVMGEGEGRHLPQLHFAKACEDSRVSTSFYHAFEMYFDMLWESAKDEWDYSSYLK